MELVSVIIPVFNSEKFVERAITSALLLPQVGEVVVVDDGSTDKSMEICLNLQKKDSRVNIFVHKGNSNRGAAESRNLGIKNAEFPFIAFLDSDDRFFETRFELPLYILNQRPELDGCYGKALVNYLNQDKNKLMGPPIDLPSKKLFSFILNGGYFHTNTLTVRKSVLEKLNGFNQTCWPHEDVELWTRLAFYGKLESIPSDLPIAEYTIHERNLSFSASIISRFALWKTVYFNFFYLPIGIVNRWYILKQLFKLVLKRKYF